MMGCTPSRDLPPDYKGDQLHFGQGGGFTGALNYFILLDDGRLFRKTTRDSSVAFVEKWDKDFVEQMFSSYQLLELNKVDHYQPGDLYYFIEFHSNGKEIHRISWGRPGFSPADNIVNFYNLLYRSTKSSS